MKIKLNILIVLALLFAALLSSCSFLNDGEAAPTDNGTETSDSGGSMNIESLDHAFAQTGETHTHIPTIDPAVEPTCTEEGKTEGSHCSVCGEILIAQNSINKKQHNYGVYPSYDSTCSKEGRTEGYGCLDCGLMVIQQSILALKKHTPINIPRKDATCSEEGSTGGTECFVCGIILTEPYIIAKLPHTAVEDAAVEANCTSDGKTKGSHCSVCGEILVAQTVVPKDETKHTFVSTSEKKPTGRKPGATVGISCSICNTIVLESKEIPALGYKDHRAYEGDFGYYFLSILEDGDKLCALYDNLDATLSKFHNDTSIDFESNDIITIINYESLGLTSSQALTVWTIYRADHPLYYWISNSVGYSGSQITIFTTEEFRLGSDRAKYNEAIYNGVLEISRDIPLDANEYTREKTIHDYIVLGMDYAYMSNGEPEEAIWAHSVVGFFVNGAGVCETYAKTFQLMLNFFDVDSIYMTGDAGEVKHAWNLAKMDDGEWYWFDLTWDDTPYTAQGFNYNYFCVTDDQPIGASDFITTHTYLPSAEYGISFVYTVPSRPSFEYVKEEDRYTDRVIRLGVNSWEIDADIKFGDLEKITKISLGNFDDMTLRDYLEHLSLDISTIKTKDLIVGKAKVVISVTDGMISSVTMTRISY